MSSMVPRRNAILRKDAIMEIRIIQRMESRDGITCDYAYSEKDNAWQVAWYEKGTAAWVTCIFGYPVIQIL